MTSEMELVVGADGVARCIYAEALDLRELGQLQITRASHVEPDAEGYWWADMGPSGGAVLGPFKSRTEALGAEREWLARHEVGAIPAVTGPLQKNSRPASHRYPSDAARSQGHRAS